MFDKETNATIGNAFARATIQFTDILGEKCKLYLFRVGISKFMAFDIGRHNRYWDTRFDDRDMLSVVVNKLENEGNTDVKIIWGGKVK